jgi:hypothetical protein
MKFTCVSVPPDITDEETSSDITVQEGENATLVCRATGHPVPRILWRREDGESLVLRKGLRDVTKGEATTYEAYLKTLLFMPLYMLGCVTPSELQIHI